MTNNKLTDIEIMQEKELQIIHGAAELYAKYGIKSITMDDVAYHLGISKKTLYQFIHDKTELVRKVVGLNAKIKSQEFNLLISKDKNAIDELFEVNHFVKCFYKDHNPSKEYDLIKYYPEIYNEIKEIRRNNVLKASKQNLEKGQKQKLYRNDINNEIIARLHVFRVENFVDNDLFSKDEIISEDFCTEVLLYHIRGIATPKGLEYLEKITL